MCLGIPGEVIAVERFGDLGIVAGKVRFGEIVRDVNLSYTPDVRVGEYVVVHVGFAISTLDEEEANRTLQYLREMGEMESFGESPSPGSRDRSTGDESANDGGGS